MQEVAYAAVTLGCGMTSIPDANRLLGQGAADMRGTPGEQHTGHSIGEGLRYCKLHCSHSSALAVLIITVVIRVRQPSSQNVTSGKRQKVPTEARHSSSAGARVNESLRRALHAVRARQTI